MLEAVNLHFLSVIHSSQSVCPRVLSSMLLAWITSTLQHSKNSLSLSPRSSRVANDPMQSFKGNGGYGGNSVAVQKSARSNPSNVVTNVKLVSVTEIW